MIIFRGINLSVNQSLMYFYMGLVFDSHEVSRIRTFQLHQLLIPHTEVDTTQERALFLTEMLDNIDVYPSKKYITLSIRH